MGLTTYAYLRCTTTQISMPVSPTPSAFRKVFLGVVNGYGDASYEGRNNVVLAHEMLHTLGASDKYDAKTNQARYPEGYAAPEQSALYPQNRAELMAGRVPISQYVSKMPSKLSRTVVGEMTAREIGWIE